jgi:hypothetical protein
MIELNMHLMFYIAVLCGAPRAYEMLPYSW